MMREIQLIKWCDVCWITSDQDTKYLAETSFVVSVMEGEDGKPVPKVLDVCEAHAAPLHDMMELLGHVAQLPSPSTPTLAQGGKAPHTPMKYVSPGQIDMIACQVCGGPIARSSYVAHIWATHRKGETRPPTPMECPECDYVSTSPQGAAQHRKNAHDYDAVANALSGVKGFKMIGRATPRRAEQPELSA